MEFLKDFQKRMKSVGRYAVLMNNSFQKITWKQYGIETIDEQVNMIFTVLMFIMEESLKEENCTIDDVAAFIGEVNDTYYKHSYTFEDVAGLAEFIVNVILSNSGSAMYFKGYNYEKKEYQNSNISYIGNRIVYLDNGVRRTSYYLTEDGYNMMLSTMEMENNLKLTVHEMLFRLHLEKADYGRAVNDIKNVFDQIRIQSQKTQEAMRRIRQNALSYSVEEYKEIVEENIKIIELTREKFKVHREVVEEKVKEFEEQNMDVHTLENINEENLENLRIIEGYLNKSLDEHQKILGEHFDLKSLYDRELENYSNMTMVQRFHLRTELYDKVLEDASMLEHIHKFLMPLILKKPDKIYNPEKAFEFQKRLRKREDSDEGSQELGFDAEELRREREEKARIKLGKYEKSLGLILRKLVEKGKISLKQLKENISEEELEELIPNLEIFREIMIEFLTEQTIEVEVLKKEKIKYLHEETTSFQLNEMLLNILEERKLTYIKKIYAMRAKEEEKVCFDNVKSENGEYRNIRCSNVELWYE